MQAKFVEGSIFSHICTMTFASTVGLLAMFLVDLVDMYWLSMLKDVEIVAGIGFAGSILFFTLSLNIGLSIGCGAMISHAVGQGDQQKTRQLVGNIFTAILFITIPIIIVILIFVNGILTALGAEGRALLLAREYLVIVLPSMPFMAIVMAVSGVLRAMGKPKQAMYLAILGSLVNAALDPVFIFYFGLEIKGAAIATVLSRLAMLGLGYKFVVLQYKLISPPDWASFKLDMLQYFQTAFPAALTNLSTPIGYAYVTAMMAQFGDAAVAGNTVIGKLQPLAFAGVFALSSSVGPIAGQNFGAQQYERIMATLTNSVYFILAYCFVACGFLFLLSDVIVNAFRADGEAAILITWFCYGLSGIFVFNGITFVTNALFNNLKAAQWATMLNFAKATIFTMPFAYVGAQHGGALGVYIGLFIGSVIVALLGALFAYKRIDKLRAAVRTAA